jgi:hypothetical protein
MSNSVNNKLLNTQSNNRPAQVYDINLNSDLISSLQESINSLSGQLNSTDSEPSIPPEESILDTPLPISNETTTSRGGNKRTSSTSSNSSSSVITRRDKPNPTTDGLAKRTYVPGADKSVKPDDQPVSQVPAIQIPFLERQPIGSETTLGNGTTITTTKNDDGTTTETIVSSTGTITKTYEDFPLDKKGNPTGFRTTIVNNNYEVTILSTVINDLGDGTFSTVTTDITDPSNPFHVMSSALKKNSDAKDDDGNSIYNSNTSQSNGFIENSTSENITFDDVDSLRRPSGYRTTYNSKDATGASFTNITETISFTDENGKRVTVVYDVTDPNNMVEISRALRDDPFTVKKKTGTGMTSQLDKINQWGLLDITGDEKLDPSSDLLLIARYLKGFRGSELTQDINLGENPKSVTELEEKISKVLNRGLLDIVGTESQTDNNDLKILARYMMGARGEVLLDKKSASDDSIKINDDGSNVLTIDEQNPILGEIQEIFGVDGKKLEFSNATGQKQNYRLFFVNTFNP